MAINENMKITNYKVLEIKSEGSVIINSIYLLDCENPQQILKIRVGEKLLELTADELFNTLLYLKRLVSLFDKE